MMRGFMAVAVLAAACSASAELKIGTVNMMELVRKHPSYETNRKLLANEDQKCQQELERLKSGIEAIQSEGKAKADELKRNGDVMLSPAMQKELREKAEKELLEIQNRYVAAQQQLRSKMMEFQQKLQELEGGMLKVTTDDLHEKVNAFAAENGYDLIIDSATTAFAKKELDLTVEVEKFMGVVPATAAADKKQGDEGK